MKLTLFAVVACLTSLTLTAPAFSASMKPSEQRVTSNGAERGGGGPGNLFLSGTELREKLTKQKDASREPKQAVAGRSHR